MRLDSGTQHAMQQRLRPHQEGVGAGVAMVPCHEHQRPGDGAQRTQLGEPRETRPAEAAVTPGIAIAARRAGGQFGNIIVAPFSSGGTPARHARERRRDHGGVHDSHVRAGMCHGREVVAATERSRGAEMGVFRLSNSSRAMRRANRRDCRARAWIEARKLF
jgi:hypothetical protein